MSYYAYVTLQDDNKVAIWALDRDTGAFSLGEEVTIADGPAPLAMDPDQRHLYVGLRGSCQLASYRIDRATGSLTLLDKAALASDPCYFSTDRSGRFLLSAYYRAGHVAVHRIAEDGTVITPPIEWRATAAKAHCIQTDATNRYAFVPHVGESNVIYQFEFDEGTGTLTPSTVPHVFAEAGLGPRHYCFHPTLDMVYFDNEQGCSVTAYRFDPAAGGLSAVQTLSTLPEGYQGENTCAQIHIDPLGRFLYAANRGHDSIACYAIDPATGLLTSVGQQRTEKMPRAFNVDPQGTFLLAAGLESGRLASYRIDGRTGALSPLDSYEVGQRPMWVLIAALGA
jgi:6-phosphogluconolactonase